MREIFALHLHFNSQNHFFFLVFPVCTSFQRIFSYYFLNPQITFQFRRQLEWINEKVKEESKISSQGHVYEAKFMRLILGSCYVGIILKIQWSVVNLNCPLLLVIL